MTAFGTATSGGESPTGIHTYAVSVFEVTFELAAASNLALDGVISVDGGLPGGVAVLIRLTGLGDQMIFEHNLVGIGRPDSQVIEEAGVLKPGEYTLRAYADISYVDITDLIPSGEAFFDFLFVIAGPCPADLDNSGDVGVKDLLILLAAWGPVPTPDPPDFDGDGFVGVKDLLFLLGNWGPCP